MAVIGEAGILIRPEGVDKLSDTIENEVDGKVPGIAKKAAGFFAVAFATVQLGGFLKDAINEASDLSESASKVGVVFGQQAQQVLDFASTSATALGLSQSAALGAAGTYGNLFRAIGLTEEQSAQFSTSLVTLSGDLASFNNVDPTVALEALRAGLTGETEPLKQFGININAAQLEAKALELGLISQGETLTDSAKAQASYALIMEQTTLAQGDFTRTSAGLANQQRIITAQFADLSANVGGLFVPILGQAASIVTGRVLPGIITLTSGLPALGDALGRVTEVFALGFSDGLGAVNDATADVTGLGFQVLQVAGFLGDLGAVFQQSFADGAGASLLAEDSIAGTVARIGDGAFRLKAVFADAWQSLVSTLLPVLGPLVASVQVAFSTIVSSIGGAFAGVGDEAGAGLGGIVGVISSILEVVVPLISGYITRYAEVFQALIPAVTTIITGLVPIISDLFAQIGPILSALLPVISQVAGVFSSVLVTAINALVPILPTLVAAIGQVVSALAGGLLSVITALAPVIPTIVTALAQVAEVLAGALGVALQAVIPIFPVLAQVVGQVAGILANGLASVLQALVPIIPPLVSALASIATVLVGALSSALQAVLPVIPSLVQVLVTLVTTALTPLLPLLPTLANLFASIVVALAPLLPPLVQIITLIIQLAVAAITPLLPLIPILVGFLGNTIAVISSLIQVVVQVASVFISFAAGLISTVLSAVSTVVGVFTSFASTVAGVFSGISSTVSSIWNNIFNFVTGIVGRLTGAVSGAFSSLRDSIIGIFGGLGDAAASALSGIGGAIRGVINGAIGIINSGIGFINSKLIDTANQVPFVDIPHIPTIPRLHTGGTFLSGQASGEGLALLRDHERVLTPEQVSNSDRLVAALAGVVREITSAGTGSGGPSVVNIESNVYAAPGMNTGEISAHVGSDLTWQMTTGATRPVPILGGTS